MNIHNEQNFNSRQSIWNERFIIASVRSSRNDVMVNFSTFAILEALSLKNNHVRCMISHQMFLYCTSVRELFLKQYLCWVYCSSSNARAASDMEYVLRWVSSNDWVKKVAAIWWASYEMCERAMIIIIILNKKLTCKSVKLQYTEFGLLFS